MDQELLDIFDDLDRQTEPKTRENIVRAPFPYPGGKSRALDYILPHLPYRTSYIEPFGGSGALLLARDESSLEVFNDRYAGVVAFYRCIRDSEKLEALCDRLRLTVHSREEFIWCKETWEHNVQDDVERAARWYYIMNYSFGSKMRNYGRATKSAGRIIAGKIQNKIPGFQIVHDRLRYVQIENQDWRQCIADYDNEEAVFYLDPPYAQAYTGIYDDGMNAADHNELIDTIFRMKGFVALSGYPNPVYDNKDWTDRFEWQQYVSMKPLAYTVSNRKKELETVDKREHSTEVLWVKEA